METHVLIPRELTLKVRPNTQSPSIAKLLEPRVSIISTVELPKGLKIHPAQGTVRCGKLELYSMFGQKDRKHRYGCYDEIVDVLLSSSSSYGISTEPETEEDVKPQQRVRRCNWPRFLTYLEDSSPGKEQAANLKCFLHEGQLFFETLERIPVHTDLIVAQANHGCDNGLPMIEAIAALMFESPLDLSLPLVSVIINNNNIMMTHKNKNHQNSNNNVIPSSALSPLLIEDRISVSSDSGLSSSEESDLFKRGHTPPSPPITPKSRTTSICSSSPRTTSLHSHNSVVKNNKNQQQNNNPRASHKKMLPCSFCGKCFDRPSLLNRHLRTHTGERPHVCDICEKGFSTSSSLNTHRRIHSGEKPHECTICGKRFTASSNLYYHRMTHVKEKPHKCELCQKSFPTPGDLKSHMYIHNGSWPHRCHICDRGFSKVTNLKNHLFLHTGQKPHECIECGKRFALGCNMKAHLKTHDPNRSNNSKRIEFDEDEEEELLNVTD